MTFEEWWESEGKYRCSEKMGAMEAWDAATQTEREACAKVCEAVMTAEKFGTNQDYYTGREIGALACANSIRRRAEGD